MITASRLGAVTWDWSNLGVRSPDTVAFQETWGKLKARFHEKDVGFYQTPIDNAFSQAQECQALADKLKGKFSDCLVLGIGGSALGPISLLSALQDRATGPKFHFQENPDALDWQSTLQKLKPESTLVCVIAKSGSTFETLALFLLAMEWLGHHRLSTHVVAITDPVKGDLKTFATDHSIPTLHIAPSLGGRFSIFSPVGLFPLALAGLSVTDFLTGAKQVRDSTEKNIFEKNPLFIIGGELLEKYPERKIHVCMPYSSRLKSFGAWFVQLWGESLGKDGKGFTPLACLGATDQHSILQLLRDGPDDKVTLFLGVDKVPNEVKIPRAPVQAGKQSSPAFKILENHTLHELLNIEYQATSLVLTKKSRPNLSLRIDQLDERSMGALYFSFSVLTAFTGTLWEINPFDQPGVEEGKVYIREALSKKPDFTDPEEDENSPVNRLRRGSS